MSNLRRCKKCNGGFLLGQAHAHACPRKTISTLSSVLADQLAFDIREGILKALLASPNGFSENELALKLSSTPDKVLSALNSLAAHRLVIKCKYAWVHGAHVK